MNSLIVEKVKFLGQKAKKHEEREQIICLLWSPRYDTFGVVLIIASVPLSLESNNAQILAYSVFE